MILLERRNRVLGRHGGKAENANSHNSVVGQLNGIYPRFGREELFLPLPVCRIGLSDAYYYGRTVYSISVLPQCPCLNGIYPPPSEKLFVSPPFLCHAFEKTTNYVGRLRHVKMNK